MVTTKKIILFLLIFGLAYTTLSANPFYTPEHTDNDTKHSLKNPKPARISETNPHITRKQNALQRKLSDVFYYWEHSSPSKQKILLINLIWISFIYGIFHGLGPGHRKTIVFSLYLTKKAPWWEPIFTAIMLAIIHAFAAIAVVAILNQITRSIALKANLVSVYTEGFSYGLLIVTAILLIAHALDHFLADLYNKDAHCPCCQGSRSNKTSLLAIFISGLYPCPGAILILILSLTLGIFKLGIISVIFISAGMTFPILTSAYLAWLSRTGIIRFFHKNSKTAYRIGFAIEMTGYLILLGFSVYISLPFWESLFM